MYKKPVVVTDVDSVLLDWLQGFTDFLEKEKNIETNQIAHLLGTTEFVDTRLITNISCMDTNKLLVREYGKSGYLENLKAFQADSIEHIKKLHKEVDFVALSCISKNRKIINQRKRNLQSVYGDIFKDVICIGFNESKQAELERLNNEENVITFIDDREKHIKESVSAGVRPILFSRGAKEIITCPNNTFDTKHCWKDISDSILLKIEIESINKKSNKNKKIDLKP